MAEPERQPPAIMPLNFSGIARYASASNGWVWLTGFIFALIGAGSITWFASAQIAPQITRAISKIPPGARITSRLLTWPGKESARLEESPFLSITIEPRGGQPLASSSDVDLILAHDHLRIRSLFGHAALPYPAGYVIELDGRELGPKWGAWSFTALTALFVAGTAGLLATWFLLAVLYAIPGRLITFYFDRKAKFEQLVKVCFIAMIPPGLFMSAAIVAFGLTTISLPAFLVAGALHFLFQPVFVLGALLCLPKLPTVPDSNPFKPPKPPPAKGPFAGTTPEDDQPEKA